MKDTASKVKSMLIKNCFGETESIFICSRYRRVPCENIETIAALTGAELSYGNFYKEHIYFQLRWRKSIKEVEKLLSTF